MDNMDQFFSGYGPDSTEFSVHPGSAPAFWLSAKILRRIIMLIAGQ
jgi:hypothetical protein